MHIDPERFGVSFSIKQCRNFGINPKKALQWLIQDAGFRRFRLMSYWDEHEKQFGKYDFTELDWQIETVAKASGVITLCLGVRQPRWPENHWPEWTWKAPKDMRDAALLKFVEMVVNRYKNQDAIISYQLENEALLKTFGLYSVVDRRRLRREFSLVKRLDPTRPVIMTTSTAWGLPVRQPIPDIVGFSYYHVYWNNRDHSYHKAGGHYALLHRLRAWSINQLLNRQSFIHELQCEPWAPKGIWEVSNQEQDKSMGADRIRQSIGRGKATKLYPIDLWGGEWWYWRHFHGDDSIWKAVRSSIN